MPGKHQAKGRLVRNKKKRETGEGDRSKPLKKYESYLTPF